MTARLTEAIEGFTRAMQAAGLDAPAEIVPDGQLHRFSTEAADPHDDAGWYVLHVDEHPAGEFGDWRTGVQQSWSAASTEPLSAAERLARQERVAALRAARQQETLTRQAEACERACTLWEQAQSADHQHPYLVKKQVQPHTLRQDAEGRLLVPMHDLSGLLGNLQRIGPDGQKRFLPGGLTKCLCASLGTPTKDHPILLCEGWATAASLHEATGYAVYAALSASNLRAVAELVRKQQPGVLLLLCGDHDELGIGQDQATGAAQAVGGFAVMPPEVGQDWNDLACLSGSGEVGRQIEESISRAQAGGFAMEGNPMPKAEVHDPGPYRVEEGRIVRDRQTRDGTITEALCNFVAKVTEELVLDDGAEPTRAFLIGGTLETGQPLPTVRVPASRFSGMSWVAEQWGLRAVLRAGQATRDYLREAIQRLSPDAKSRRIFTHTGWCQVDGVSCYLTSGGAVGRDGLEVDLGPELSRYRLPQVAEDPADAMKVSFQLFRVAPLHVTAPLWAGAFRAPLASLYPLDVSLWLEGQTGSLKSTLAALVLCHFGDFDRTHLPGTWSSTPNALERRAFLLKDALFVVDDYAPSALDARELETKAGRLLRAQGNLAGRGRLRADLTERPAYPPRGLIFSTGEQHPPGQSLLARMVLLELDRDSVDLARLSALQQTAGRLSHALSGYLAWLAPQMPTLGPLLRETFEGARQRATADGEHLRVPEALAHLWVGLDCGLAYASECRACSAAEADALRAECWDALLAVGRAQGLAVAEERPTLRFLHVLLTLILQKRAILLGKDDPVQHHSASPDIVGWQDDTYLYLIPEASALAVNRFCRESGEPFPLRQERIRRDLSKEGLTESDPGRFTATVRIGGNTRRVLRLQRTAAEAAIGQEFPSPVITGITGYGR